MNIARRPLHDDQYRAAAGPFGSQLPTNTSYTNVPDRLSGFGTPTTPVWRHRQAVNQHLLWSPRKLTAREKKMATITQDTQQYGRSSVSVWPSRTPKSETWRWKTSKILHFVKKERKISSCKTDERWISSTMLNVIKFHAVMRLTFCRAGINFSNGEICVTQSSETNVGRWQSASSRSVIQFLRSIKLRKLETSVVGRRRWQECDGTFLPGYEPLT